MLVFRVSCLTQSFNPLGNIYERKQKNYSVLSYVPNSSITSICKIQKQTQKQSQTTLKIFFTLIGNKTAKITYLISKRQNAMSVRLYLTFFLVLNCS